MSIPDVLFKEVCPGSWVFQEADIGRFASWWRETWIKYATNGTPNVRIRFQTTQRVFEEVLGVQSD